MNRRAGALAACALVVACLAEAGGAAAAPIRYLDTAFFWSSPFPQGETLRAIDFEGPVGYAIAVLDEYGFADEYEVDTALIHTADGGRSWNHVEAGAENLRRVHILDATTTVVEACGLIRSDDGGASFRRLPLPTGSERCLRAASFVSARQGYVLLHDGGVVHTSDGGSSFAEGSPVPGVTSQTVSASIEFDGPDVGVAIRDGIVYRTTDRARTWTQVAAGRARLRDIELNGPNGYAVGDEGSVLRTTDGGATWAPRPVRGAMGRNLVSVRCLNGSTCLLLTDEDSYSSEPAVLRTSDGAESASEVSDSVGIGALDVEPPSGAALAGTRGRILRSDDAGAIFTPVSRTVPTGSLRFTPPSTVHSFDGGAGIGRSTDGGRTWTEVVLPLSRRETLSDLSFSGATHGLAVAASGPYPGDKPYSTRVVRTRDSGRTWQTVSRGDSRRRARILDLGRGDVVAAGYVGASRSVDGGARFRRIRSPALRGLEVRTLDRAGGAVLARGDERFALSTNRGRTWRRLRLPSRLRYPTVEFASRRVGFAAEGTRLFRTRNGGRTWKRLLSNSGREVARISFADRRRGFLDASEQEGYAGMDDYDPGFGSLLRTDDGGRTWTPVPLRYAAPIESLEAVGDEGAVVGLGGTLVWTATAGRGSAPTRLRLSRDRRIRRPGRVVIRGSLSLRAGRRAVTVSRFDGREWFTRSATVAADGSFRSVWHLGATAWFIATVSATRHRAGAGTSPVTVRVRSR